MQHTGTITAPTTWLASDTHVVSGQVTVNAGVQLTIEPGAVVKFNSGGILRINGALDAAGTPGDPIIFTSYRDDTADGDTNGDGISEGQPGDWTYLFLSSTTTTALTNLSYLDIRYGGSNTGAFLPYADVTADNVTVTHSATTGIYGSAASPLITNCMVEDNVTDGLYLLGNGAPEVRDCRIANNGEAGIQVVSSNTAPLLVDNEIVNNAGFGIQFDDARSPAPPIAGNTLRGNSRPARLPWASLPAESEGNIWGPNLRNAIWVLGSGSSDRLTDLTIDVRKSAGGVPAEEAYEIRTYVMNGGFEMAAGTTLTIDPGVVLKFETTNSYLWPQLMNAVGTAANPIVLTSFKDDVYGGDTNGDGAASQAAPGDWTYLYFQSVDGSNIENALLRYGGASTGMLWTSGADMTLTNVELAFSATSGFYSNGASHVLTDVESYGHRRHGFEIVGTGTQTVSGGRSYANLLDGIRIGNSSGGSYNDMELFANAGAAINHTSSQAIDATGNWWGAADGPGGNEVGSGDAVVGTGTLDVTGFLTTGTASSYANTGSDPFQVEGTVAAPTVLAGTVSTEFGASASQSALFDLDAVELSYPTLDPAARYDVFVTYVNTDNTSGVGGNQQRLLADGEVVHDALLLPTLPGVFRYTLPPAAYADGASNLLFEKLSGYRAVVSQVILVETPAVGDTEAPITTIIQPVDGSRLTGGTVQLSGTVADPQGSALSMVEFGYRTGGGQINWQAVGSYTTDGDWEATWTLPADGDYELFARAQDMSGNIGLPVSPVNVVVDQTSPAPPTNLAAFDTPGDTGGSIDLSWTPSDDDGAGADDVTTYSVERENLSISGSNLLLNPGFESGASGWTFAGGGADTCPSPCTSPRTGSQAGYKNLFNGGAGTISQVLPTTVGGEYTVEIWLADNGVAAGNITVSLGSTQGISVTEAQTSGTYTQYTFNHTATGSATLFEIGGLVTSGTFFIDDVVVRAASGGAAPGFTEIASVGAGASSFTDTSAVDGAVYQYRLVAIDTTGNRSSSEPSETQTSIDNSGDVTPPVEATNLVGFAGNEFVRVTWTPSVNTDGDIITQVLDLSTDGGGSYGAEILVGRDVSSYRFDGLTNGTSYTVRLRQRDAAVPANTSAGVVVGPLVPETTSVTELSGTLPVGVTSFSNEVIRVTGSVTVPSGATLSLGPGTVMKFNVNTSLDVFGHLDARGTALEPVVFTSYRDDSIGGDTNGDGASVGQPGDWYYVYIRQATPGATAFMEHAQVRYAGGAGSGGLLAFRFSEVELSNLLVEEVSTTGILLRDNASAVLDNSLVRNNATNGVYVQRSSGGGGTFTITNNEIRDNGTTGLYVQNYGVTITGNQFIDNTNYGVFYTGLSQGVAEELRGNTISGSNVPARLVLPAVPGEGAGNTISGNTRDHLEVIGTSLTQNRTLDMAGFSAYWLVSGNVAVQPGASLQLREGVIWKLALGSQFQIDGVFSSEGSSANPVIFTSYRDDSVGGDTNGDGLSSGQPGDWYWLYVTANSPSLLSSMAHTEVRFGGSSSLGALLPYNDMLLDHVTVRD
ncbi:MAG: right-handed parallel beta-helix repeat-containing protein, partial [Pseudomonadota bacterium]